MPRHWRIPKTPRARSFYNLYKLVASEAEAEQMAASLRAGGYGWGHAKKALLEAVVDGFAREREEFNRWMNDKSALDAELAKGAETRPSGRTTRPSAGPREDRFLSLACSLV